MGIQVFEATHDREGNPSLFGRQFISFSYGGKYIEDFGLIAVFNNDRLTKDIYAPFSDTTTSQTEIDGQLFWQSKYNANQLSFTLATDGMTSRQYEDFKAWFVPGVARELILAEHSNRAIMARVSAAPALSVVPFEDIVEIVIGDNSVPVRTTLYKGQITLNFVMDDPFWYSKNIYFATTEGEENLKVMYEDNLPLLSKMGTTSCFLGGNLYYSGSSISENSEGQNLSSEPLNLFYSGSAPAQTELNFSIVGTINNSTGKISFSEDNNLFEIKINNTAFVFTYPEIINSYNRALDIVSNYEANSSYLDLRAELRDNIFDYYVRAYVMSLIDNAGSNNIDINTGAIKENFFSYFIEQMKNFFTGENLIFTFNIKGETGAATVSTNVSNSDNSITENAGDIVRSKHLIIEPIDGLNIWEANMKYHNISSNINLINFKIKYNNMYL